MTRRDLQLLRAVQTGRVTMTVSSEPHLRVDGRHVADADVAEVTHHGWIAPAIPAQPGAEVRAQLTDAGQLALQSAGGAW